VPDPGGVRRSETPPSGRVLTISQATDSLAEPDLTTAVNGATKPSMNEANERDPYNNNSYGTIVDSGYKLVNLPVLDVLDFNERIIRGYEEGWGERDLPADLTTARSLIPAGTATLRDFSNISPEIPEYIPDNCTGCMDC